MGIACQRTLVGSYDCILLICFAINSTLHLIQGAAEDHWHTGICSSANWLTSCVQKWFWICTIVLHLSIQLTNNLHNSGPTMCTEHCMKFIWICMIAIARIQHYLVSNEIFPSSMCCVERVHIYRKYAKI